MLNRVIIGGRSCAQPELRYTQSGIANATFTMAVDRPFKNAQGEKETDFVKIVTWRKTAEFISEHLDKGKRCIADGRLQVRSYEAQDGSRRQVTEVVAESVQIVDWRDKGEPGGGTQGTYSGAPADDEDLPF